MREIPKILKDYRFRFIPLKDRDKIPIEKSWQEKAQYKFDDPFLLSHLEKGGNIGIVCNKGTPLVIDFDNEEIEKRIAPLLPKTFTVRSGRGRLHKYFIVTNPENMKILDKDKNTLCDIQADRKQVVIPPSIHPNGNEYYVLDDSEITNIDMSEIKALFYDYLPKDKIKLQTHKTDNAAEIKRTLTFERILKDYGVDVSRNPTMCPLGHHSESQKCFHYDDSKGVAYCFHCEWGGDIISLIEEKENIEFIDALKFLVEKYNLKIDIMTSDNSSEDSESSDDRKTTNLDMAWECCQQLLENHKFISQGESEKSTIYFYSNGIYVPSGKQFIHQFVERKLGKFSTRNIKNEVVSHIYAKTIVDSLPEASPELLCIENGILNVLTRSFIPHSSDKVFFQKIPITYQPTSVCPSIEKFLAEILKPEDLITIKKWAGYCLLKDYRYHNLLMLNGGGANGKSTLLSLLKKFLGEQNVCSIPMQQLENDKFALVLLKNKLANIFADLPSSALHSTSKLKGLTGEDNFSADQKFKDHIGFQSYAKQMFSCNQLPILPEDNEAIWRRFILIDMPYTFDITKRDVGLISKLTKADELSGFLNYALDGLKQLTIDNGFEKAIEKTREQYMRKTDPIGTFVFDCLYKNSTGYIFKEEIYNEYCEYCTIQGYDVELESVFFKRLKTKIPCHYGQTKRDGRRVTAVFGVEMKVCLMCKGYFSSCSSIGSNELKHKFIFNFTPNGSNQMPLHSLQLQLQNTFDRRLMENLINIMEHLKHTLEHIPSFIEIQEYTGIPEQQLDKILTQLKKEGQVYEPRPDNYEVLK